MLMASMVYRIGSNDDTTDCATDVLPVPTGPVISTGWPASMRALIKHSYRTVSTVGTVIL